MHFRPREIHLLGMGAISKLPAEFYEAPFLGGRGARMAKGGAVFLDAIERPAGRPLFTAGRRGELFKRD